MKVRPLFLLFVLAFATAAFGDGGRLRLQKPAGPFLVTLFTAPDPLTEGTADFSIAVEREGVSGLIQDATVTVILTPVDRDGDRLVLRASHGAATSRFLQAANFTLPSPGFWLVTIVVQQGDDVGKCSEELRVLPKSLVTDQVMREVAVLPIFMILYSVHQWRKRIYMRERRSRFQHPTL